jgi:hypothetical protein
MSLTIADLITVEERDDVLATLLALASLLGQPTTSWQEGAPILTMLTTDAQKMADLTSLAVEITKGGFGELLPSDSWADRWALSRFNVNRVPATQATGAVNAANSSASIYTLAIGQLIIAHATTGKLYRNTAAIVIPAGGSLSGIAIAADEAGTASNAAPAAITTVVSSQVGVTVTNPLSVLGTDKETTAALVTRARAKLGALSPNGPKDAYNHVATTPALSTTSTPVTRTRTVTNDATGAVSVYLATASGAPSAPDVAIVQSAIDTYAEPWGVTATAIAAMAHVVNITYQVWVQGSQLTSAQIQTAIATALAAFFATLDLGGYVIPPDTGDIYTSTLQIVIAGATPGIRRVTITVPAADVVLTSNEVATLGTLTPTVTLL